MEKKHKQRLQQKFDPLLKQKKIIILDIEDKYQYMEEELILSLRAGVSPFL
jgi:protein-tyrosine phosphatase